MADVNHSWCTPFAIGMSPTGSTSSVVNQIVTYVCGAGGFPSCCDQNNGRWTLTCVQAGAEYAKNTLNQGDICGRYAWALGPMTQGPLQNRTQLYPRDFNLFTLSGDATGFTDVQGPVAAAGNVSANYFGLNNGSSDPYGLIALGNVTLKSGTIHGNIIYGGSYSGQSVTIVNPFSSTSPAPAPSQNAQVIDFASASTQLSNMSAAMYQYVTVPSTKLGNTITFRGIDPELNVFSVAASNFTGTTAFAIDVPSGSAVIINVIGTTATMMNAGISGPNGGSLPTSPNKILWNFPSATSLTIQSVNFVGSVLAPLANATFKYGSLTGTVVAKSAYSNGELTMAPYQVPGCTGCLCIDSSWSCSNDTMLDYSTKANPVIGAEAGFLEIDGGPYIAESVARTSPIHRIWYSFQPALNTPKSKPLAVLFNGGPGTATSAFLFSFNTATWTLDPNVVNGKNIALNKNNWTQFANLLYIDAPATGFSYPRPYNGMQQDIGIDMDRDAGIFLRVIARFLVRHPALLSNRVIVVGESYGGTRATLMLNYLYNYQSLASPSSAYQDSQVRTDLSSYFSAAFQTTTPSASAIATVFGHQVLIEPVLVGTDQQSYVGGFDSSVCKPPPPCTSPGCATQCYQWGVDSQQHSIPPTCDEDNCDMLNSAQPNNQPWSDYEGSVAATNLNIAATLSQALGVDATTITWMKYSARTDAYGRDEGFSSSDMVNNFGHLVTGDNYFVQDNIKVRVGYGGNNQAPYTPQNPRPARTWDDGINTAVAIGTNFLNNVSVPIRTFITVTKFDSLVWSPSIAYALNDGHFSSLVASSGVAYDPTYATYVTARPGAMTIDFNSGLSSTVTMPTRYESGHTVPMRAPAQLLADVVQWYSTFTY